MDTYTWIGTVLLYMRLHNISGAFEAYCSSQVQILLFNDMHICISFDL